MKRLSEGEETLAIHLRARGIAFEREYRFAPPRRWRADFRIGERLLVEVEGGIWVQGRHNRASSIEADFAKYNAATVLGFTVLRYSTAMVTSGEAIADIVEWRRKYEL